VGLTLLPLGVGDAFSARWYSSCLALRDDATGGWLLVDCPHPIRKMMKEAGDAAGVSLDVVDLLGVVVTHLHADHASGLEGLGYFGHFVLRRRLPLLAHPDVVHRIWEGHLAAGMERLLPKVGAEFREMHFGDYFEHVPLDTGATVALGPFEVECRKTIHHIPTTALRVRAGGRRLGYSADTAFDPGLIDWLHEADLVLHETNLGVHTPYESLAALSAERRARMRLIHYTDLFDLDASTSEPLRQGRLYAV
jgi:glyoxylase-like metal-dependent hydrolase (beta-lactamase superfamily II)